MPPVTRAVAFKYKADATDEQKRRAIEDLIKLYDSKANIFTTKPRGGKVQDAGWLSKGFDAVFVISFKSEDDMKKFDSDDEEHEKYKKTEVQALVEDISVLGFVDGEWGF